MLKIKAKGDKHQYQQKFHSGKVGKMLSTRSTKVCNLIVHSLHLSLGAPESSVRDGFTQDVSTVKWL